MARIFEVFLHIERAVRKGALSLRTRGVISLDQTRIVARNAHAAPAAARHGLDDDRIFELVGHFERLLLRKQNAVAARRGRDPGLLHRVAGDRLVAERAHRLGRRPDEGDAVLAARLGEIGVLRKKAVAGVNRIDVADRGDRQNPVDQQITLARSGRADADRFVGHPHRKAVGIRLRIDRDRPDAEFPAGPDDAQRDFAAVGYQNLIEHSRFPSPFIRLRTALPRTRPAGRSRRGFP